jgi:hypothetical protein
MPRNLTKLAAALLAALFITPLAKAMAAQPTPFSQVFCGGWMSSPPDAAGMSNITMLSSMSMPNSMGNAYSDTCGGTQDGMYKWSVKHGTVNTLTQHGTEHGTFNETFTSGSMMGDTLGGIFDGQIHTYNAAALALCTGSDTSSGTTPIYKSVGNFNTLKNNSDITGEQSSFHAVGTYTVVVKQDSSNNCHFEADLTGEEN